VSEDVVEVIQNLQAVALDRLISDHRPIILKQAIDNYGPIPINFYNSWLQVLEFDIIVKEAWVEAHAITVS